jgi:hypothetical protein
MINKIFLIYILILIPLSSAPGQERIDVIYLKNGDILKGIIFENIPNDYIKIDLSGGSIITVKYADILKITREKQSIDTLNLQESRQPGLISQSDDQKMILYEMGKKSPGLAVLLSLILTSTGHAYAGNWDRGIPFTAGRIGGAILAIGVGIRKKTNYSTSHNQSYSYETTEITPLYYIGFGMIIVFSIWEAIDASAEVNKYNENLYNKIMGKNKLGLNIVPNKNGLHIQLSYSF